MESKINVTFFVSGLASGGMENYLLRFLKEKHQDFKTISVYCKSGKDGDLDNEFASIENVRIYKNKIGYFSLKAFNDLKTFFKNNQIDSVCDFTGSFGGLTMFAAYSVKIPIRVVFYRNSREKYKSSLAKDLYRKLSEILVYNYANHILSNSYAALDYFYPNRSGEDKRFEVIYNGINVQKFVVKIDRNEIRKKLGLPEDAFVIGHVGRFDSQKNHLTMIKVLRHLFEKHDDIYAVFCGHGVDRNGSDLIGDNIILQKRLRLFGNRSDVNFILKSLDLFFFPSTIEGQPNALIEAMVSGVPIVASNIDPIKETTPPIAHANLKNPMDVDGFIESIERFYKVDSSMETQLVKEWAIKNFDGKQKFEQFYKKLIF